MRVRRGVRIDGGATGSDVDKPRQHALEAHQVERALGKGEVQGSNPCGGSYETVRMQVPVQGSLPAPEARAGGST